MKNYQFLNKTEENIRSGMKPLEAMDITALCFMLKPYDDQDDFSGALEILTTYYQWDDWQTRRILRIKSIRNLISHEKYDNGFEKSDENILNGLQEKKWLNELEDIIKRIKTSFNLMEYQVLLEQAIENKLKESGHEKRISFFMSDGENVRNAYCKIHKFDFSEAPIGEPLTGAAPWTNSNADLEDLPWPSMLIEAENEKRSANTNANTWTEKTNLNYKDDMTWVDEKIQETVNKTFDKIDKRVNKLFGLFGGKK